MSLPLSAGKRSLPSLLPSAYRRLLVLALVFAAFMLANTLYLLVSRWADLAGIQLLAGGRTVLPKSYQAMVLTHTGVGLLLAVLMTLFLLIHLRIVWKRHHRTAVVSGVLFVTAELVLVVTGLFVLTEAASSNNRWAWWLHVICGALIPVAYAAHRLMSYSRPRGLIGRGFVAAVATGALVLFALHVSVGRGARPIARSMAASEVGTLLFGLGGATIVDSLIVRWPISGITSRIGALRPGQRYLVTEGGDGNPVVVGG
ncbi:MAG: ASPIC/UnbV domain-containing protein [Gemmatimonadota bacterium]|nr:MAG: ASPIC/UnbV domain-containing protein [Gemmatimonadota bacterium]